METNLSVTLTHLLAVWTKRCRRKVYVIRLLDCACNTEMRIAREHDRTRGRGTRHVSCFTYIAQHDSWSVARMNEKIGRMKFLCSALAAIVMGKGPARARLAASQRLPLLNNKRDPTPFAASNYKVVRNKREHTVGTGILTSLLPPAAACCYLLLPALPCSALIVQTKVSCPKYISFSRTHSRFFGVLFFCSSYTCGM